MPKSIPIFFSFLLLFLSVSKVSLANNPDAIVGYWKTGEGKGIIHIYKEGDKYFGKISNMKEPNDPITGKPKLDVKNDNKQLQTRPILGLVNLRNFKFVKQNLWKEGNIYDPNTGNDYSCKITMIDNNTIEVRGYVGISILGRTDTWRRQNSL